VKLHKPVIFDLAGPVPGGVVERDGAILALIQCRGGTLELTREELLSLGTAARELVQQVDEAQGRRIAGMRPIPAHGQPARPYTAVPAGPAAMMPTTLAPPASHLASVSRHAALRPPAPPAGPGPEAGQEGQVVPDPPAAATTSG
jgi:hypothetical protein